MPETPKFHLVFQKLQEATAEELARDTAEGRPTESVTVEELDEISELRRLALSFDEVDVPTYTTTT